ncbi:hypothetical protein NDU88_002238 [Pleurodeles waltl]|uniref:Uncharacterized protein n=1 Tax=Pleurodeles waltl TaxID=8319 RepID=A0AAV7UZ82_PLEWA|nr:hypothetical protein NDU88_002238 [Pleurodeles waltl]
MACCGVENSEEEDQDEQGLRRQEAQVAAEVRYHLAGPFRNHEVVKEEDPYVSARWEIIDWLHLRKIQAI